MSDKRLFIECSNVNGYRAMRPVIYCRYLDTRGDVGLLSVPQPVLEVGASRSLEVDLPPTFAKLVSVDVQVDGSSWDTTESCRGGTGGGRVRP